MMKKVSQHRRMLVLAVSILMVLNIGTSLAVNPASATKDTVSGTWGGTQVPGPTTVHKVRIVGDYIIIYGKLRMDVTGGYEFGEVVVVYEVIRYMEIEVPLGYGWILDMLREFLSEGGSFNDLDPNVVGMLYSFPRSGWFTWHAQNGRVVGKGTFVFHGPPHYYGELWATVRGYISVYGTFHPLPSGKIVHTGYYTAR